MDMWQGADEVVIVDAMHSKSEPGTVRVFKPLEEPLPTGTFASSHATGVAETIDWTAALVALDQNILSLQIVRDTLGVVLKYQDDIAKIDLETARQILSRVKASM